MTLGITAMDQPGGDRVPVIVRFPGVLHEQLASATGRNRALRRRDAEGRPISMNSLTLILVRAALKRNNTKAKLVALVNDYDLPNDPIVSVSVRMPPLMHESLVRAAATAALAIGKQVSVTRMTLALIADEFAQHADGEVIPVWDAIAEAWEV